MVAPPLEPADYSSGPTNTNVPAMPVQLRSELDSLNSWAETNNKAASSDAFRFWFLKIPAILFTAIGSYLTYINDSNAALIVGLITGIFILLDGIIRPGIMRNARYLAYYETRELETTIVSKWNFESLKEPEQAIKIAASLIEELNGERSRISGALKIVEAN